MRSYVFEAGAGFVLDGELHGSPATSCPRDGATILDAIEASGAPALLLEHYAGRLEYHEPWHLDRDVSHLFRGEVDAAEADALLDGRRPRARCGSSTTAHRAPACRGIERPPPTT